MIVKFLLENNSVYTLERVKSVTSIENANKALIEYDDSKGYGHTIVILSEKLLSVTIVEEKK